MWTYMCCASLAVLKAVAMPLSGRKSIKVGVRPSSFSLRESGAQVEVTVVETKSQDSGIGVDALQERRRGESAVSEWGEARRARESSRWRGGKVDAQPCRAQGRAQRRCRECWRASA